MASILKKIIKVKKDLLSLKKREISLKDLKKIIRDVPAPKDFTKAISKKDNINIIAEIKKASPSADVLRNNFNVSKIAIDMKKGGACAISVLTEEKFFKGNLSYLNIVHNTVDLPVLRKDFIIDEYQIFESRANNSDAILLIASILHFKKLRSFLDLARSLEICALVEVHNEEELKDVLKTKTKIIGINNRNLKDFSVNIQTTLKLKKFIPSDRIVVSESGIKTYSDIMLLKEAQINAILIGEVLMRSRNIVDKLKQLSKKCKM